MPLKIGTSGWQYRDWRGPLYPAGLPQRRWLEHYARQYLTVENNNSFYRLPARETFESWRDQAPGDFEMTVKASRYLTHFRRLRDPAEPVARLLGAAAGLGPRLGPVLLQLPPTLQGDPELLDACLKEFRTASAALGGPALRVAVEPRHETWWTGQVRQVLAAHDAALCWADRRGRPVSPLWRTASWGYLRFHEGTAHPWPRYGRQALRSWVTRLGEACQTRLTSTSTSTTTRAARRCSTRRSSRPWPAGPGAASPGRPAPGRCTSPADGRRPGQVRCTVLLWKWPSWRTCAGPGTCWTASTRGR
jgi:uncharacterized protein YecE (DUF72 family)